MFFDKSVKSSTENITEWHMQAPLLVSSGCVTNLFNNLWGNTIHIIYKQGNLIADATFQSISSLCLTDVQGGGYSFGLFT